MGTGEQVGLPACFGDVFIDSLGPIGILSKERTTSDPVLSSGIFAGLTNSKFRPLGLEPGFPDLIPSVLSTASIEPTGLHSQGALLTALYYLPSTLLKMHWLFKRH